MDRKKENSQQVLDTTALEGSFSDRDVKTAFEDVEPEEVLEGVAALPIRRWSYIYESDVRHLGPMAQDFAAIFGLGDGNTRIHAIDEGGVALASIQALHRRVKELEHENAELRTMLRDLERRLDALGSARPAA